MNKYEYNGLKRINKTTARKLFNNGDTIRICACKIDPINDFYHLYNDINKTDLSKYVDFKDFDTFINQYEYYNCNFEDGYYTAFYKMEA